MSKSYEELEGMIEVTENEASAVQAGSLRITCREADSSWIDTSYIVLAEQVDTDDDYDAYDFVYGDDADDGQPNVKVWKVSDPHSTEYVHSKDEAREWMIEAASLYYDAEDLS